jgi:hypothetical protein
MVRYMLLRKRAWRRLKGSSFFLGHCSIYSIPIGEIKLICRGLDTCYSQESRATSEALIQTLVPPLPATSHNLYLWSMSGHCCLFHPSHPSKFLLIIYTLAHQVFEPHNQFLRREIFPRNHASFHQLNRFIRPDKCCMHSTASFP